MARRREHQKGLFWALVGAAVLVAGLIAIAVASALNSADHESPPDPDPSTSVSTPSGPSGTGDEVVEPDVSEFGWAPEPITTNSDVYIRGALEAASSFDTQLSDRNEWLTYLDTWFTPDTRYSDPADQVEVLEVSQLELRQSVVLPEHEWDSLALDSGRVVATVTGDLTYVDVPGDATGDMSIGTANVTLTFTRTSGDGSEHEYEETVRVSVQVLCGPASVPTPDTAQQSGDCKIVRYFPEPMEP